MHGSREPRWRPATASGRSHGLPLSRMRRYGATGGGRERPRSGRSGAKERRRPPTPTPTHPESPEPLGGDSGRSDGPGPSKPSNPAPSSETGAVGSPQIDEDAAPRGTGTPGFVACGCQRPGCHAVFDGPPGSTACPSCAAAPEGAAVKAWTHAPGPDGGTRCGKGSGARDVLARAGEATCPDCRSAIETGQAPEPDTSENGPGPEELDEARAMLDAYFRDLVEGGPYLESRGRADPDVRGGPIMARARGAPLDLRIFVGAVLWTPHHARATRGRLAVTVRELRDFLYPNGWTRGRHWPAIQEALLRARDYLIPGVFPSERGNVHGWATLPAGWRDRRRRGTG